MGTRAISCSEGRFEKDRDVPRFTLGFPVLRGEFERAGRILLEVQPEAGFFLQVQLLAPHPCLRKAVIEGLDALGGGRPVQCLFCVGEAQQQRIGARPVLQEHGDLPGAGLVEQEVRVGRQQEVIRHAECEGITKVFFGDLWLPEPAGHLREAGQVP